MDRRGHKSQLRLKLYGSLLVIILHSHLRSLLTIQSLFLFSLLSPLLINSSGSTIPSMRRLHVFPGLISRKLGQFSDFFMLIIF